MTTLSTPETAQPPQSKPNPESLRESLARAVRDEDDRGRTQVPRARQGRLLAVVKLLSKGLSVWAGITYDRQKTTDILHRLQLAHYIMQQQGAAAGEAEHTKRLRDAIRETSTADIAVASATTMFGSLML